MASGNRILSVILDIAGQILRGLSSSSASKTHKNPSGTRQTGSSRATFKKGAQPGTSSPSGPSTPRQNTAAPTRKPGRSGAGRSGGTTSAQAAELRKREARLQGEPSPGQLGDTATFEVEPPSASDLTIAYEPSRDGDADAGEVVWTWIPYEERDGRGKDRPVLVIARGDATHVYVVRLTSKSHDGDRDFLSIGSGAWDSQGRESWVDVDQLYLVHRDGLRREAAVLDRDRFLAVAEALHRRYGWGA